MLKPSHVELEDLKSFGTNLSCLRIKMGARNLRLALESQTSRSKSPISNGRLEHRINPDGSPESRVGKAHHANNEGVRGEARGRAQGLRGARNPASNERPLVKGAVWESATDPFITYSGTRDAGEHNLCRTEIAEMEPAA